MPIRKIFVGFCMLLICFQLLLVQQIISVLNSRMITEQILQSPESEHLNYPEDAKNYEISTQYLLFKNDFLHDAFLFDKELIILIITRTADDIKTPPPNQVG